MVKLRLRSLTYLPKPIQPVAGRASISTQVCVHQSPTHHIKFLWTQPIRVLY